MKYSIVFTTLSVFTLSQLAHALPALQGDYSPDTTDASLHTGRPSGDIDIEVLNFALTLEHLENAFYNGALDKFSQKDFDDAGVPSQTRGRFVQIAQHEKTHVDFLSAAIGGAGAEPAKPDEYTFPYTDVKSFIDLSSILEDVGASAYTGAAKLISNKDYLTAAASILSVEGRHDAWINSVDPMSPPWNSAFETPLSPKQVYTLASAFIKSADRPPYKPFPKLSIPANAHPGDRVTLDFVSDRYDASGGRKYYVAFAVGNEVIYEALGKDKMVTIPRQLVGNVFAMVTDHRGKSDDDSIIAGPAILRLGLNAEGRAN